MLKSEIRNPKSEIWRFSAAAGIAILACAAANAAPERVGPALGPVLKIEIVKPAPHFEFSKHIYWYPHVLTKHTWSQSLERLATERQAGGLAMKLREDILPGSQPPGGVWFTLFRPIHGQAHPGVRVEPSPVCFGTIRPAPMLPGEHFLSGEETTWGANKLSYTYTRPGGGGEAEAHFSITVSRLTPGVMIESESEMVIFFSELPNTPRHFAWPEADEIRTHTLDEDEVRAARAQSWELAVKKDPSQALLDDFYTQTELDEPGWVLTWFGEKGGYFYTSRDAGWLHDFHIMASSGEGHPIGPERMLKRETGSTTEADMPFLLAFQNPPLSFCAVEGGGIMFTFAGAAGRIVLCPLFGEDPPAAGEVKGWNAGVRESTRPWAAGLPDDVRAKCEWWDRRLREFPVDVEESARYDEASDELTLKYSFKYEAIGESGIKFAPVPPMLTLAAKHGFPARLPEHVEPGYRTQVGPYIGVENADEYEIRMSGLGKYARQARTAGRGECPESRKLEARLWRETEKILDAGRLAPGLYHSGMVTKHPFRGAYPFVFDRPGQTIGCLADALCFIAGDREQERVIAYMKDEQAARPAERTFAVPIRDGARREPFRLDTRMPKWRNYEQLIQKTGYQDDIIDFADFLIKHNDRYIREQLSPPDALYAMAEFARRVPGATMDWSVVREIMSGFDARRDWATLGLVKRIPSRIAFDAHTGMYRQGGGRDGSSTALANAFFAGCIGAARLASVPGSNMDAGEAYARFYLAAAHRFALEAYGQWLYAEGLLGLPENFKPDTLFKRYAKGAWVTWSGFIVNFTPESDPRRITAIDEMRVCLARDGSPLAGEAVPELGRFLNDLLGERLRTRAAAAYSPPDWFLWSSGGYSRGHRKALGNAEFFFHAWIQGASAEELAAWAGAPWAAVGDLYYIQRLIEALYACRGVEWLEWKRL